MKSTMTKLLPCLSLLISILATSNVSFAQDAGTLVFADDFERTESQELKDEPGNGWTTNSEKRAGGNKQVDLKDGTMVITMHAEADHGVSVVHDAEFVDGQVELRFLLPSAKDSLGLDFADMKFKQVHAGHLFKVTLGTQKTTIDDMKTGGMNLKYRERKKSKTLTAQDKKELKATKKTIKSKIEPGQWHDLVIKIVGDSLSVTVDGEEIGSFTSPGFAHPTKRTLRVAVLKTAAIDDLRVTAFEK